MSLTVAICNSFDILYSQTFREISSFSLSWNGTDQRSQFNASYCITISALSELTTAVPVEIEFDLTESEVVLPYSLISVGNSIMFETLNLLVLIDLRDQWNFTIDQASSSVEIYDKESQVVGSATTELRYNATLKSGQLMSKKTLYLGGVNETVPHVTFYGIPLDFSMFYRTTTS